MNDSNNWSQDERVVASLMTNGLNEMSEGSCPSIEQIAQLVEGTLTESERDLILKHAAGCDDCFETLKVSRQLHQREGSKKMIHFRPWAMAASIVIVVLSAILFYQIGIDKSDLAEPASTLKEEELRYMPKDASKTYSKSKKGAPLEDNTRMKSVAKKGEKTWDETPRGTAKNVFVQKRGRDEKGKGHEAGEVENKKSEPEGKVLEKQARIQMAETESLKKSKRRDQKLAVTMDQEMDKQNRQVAGKRVPAPAKPPARKVQQKNDTDWYVDGVNVQQEAARPTTTGEKPARCFRREQFSQSTQYTSGLSRQQLPRQELSPALLSSQNLPMPAAIEGVITFDILLDIEIDSKGNVMGICVQRGLSFVSQKLIDRLFSWKFKPVMKRGKPAPIKFPASLTYDFSENIWLFNGRAF